MIKTIWKFPIRTVDEQMIKIPMDYKLLSVHTQFGDPCIWALVDPEQPKVNCRIKIFGTGHPIDLDDIIKLKYLGTYLISNDSLVFHVFEERF